VIAQSGLVDQWRDLGPVLWLVAAGGAVVWALLLAAVAFATRSRNVRPGPPTLDLGGPEPPAVVSLITDDWRLGHEAVPATLLDLAARKLLAIDQVGDRTLVRVRPDSDRARELIAELEPYERLVLDHVTAHATDGVVPAEALTTGPEEESRGWWKSFRKAVERDARRRGLSRKRWAAGVRLVLTVAAITVAVLVGVASTTLADDPDDPDDDPIGRALAFSAITAGALIAAAEALNGERDTPAGREAAARWLGLREMLAEDPLFAEHPPAGVAIWDRLLAHGAAMGVAHGAVRALPLGAESDREAWSSVGGHWRVVRIRYPRFVPPGWGRHPGLVAALGVGQLGLAVLALPVATAAADALRDLVTDFSADDTVPAGFGVGVGIILGFVVAAATVLAVRGGWMAFAGGADLLSQRRPVEGRALRVRRRGDDEHPRWYVAVDDGTTPRIKAWRTAPGGVSQGSTVQADVTRWLAHVRNLEVLAAAPARPSLPDDEDEDDLSPTQLAPLPAPAAAGPPPPLPDAGVVSDAAGRPLELDPSAKAHPFARDGRSATFVGAGGAMVQVAWIDPAFLHAHKSMPRFLRRELRDVGDEAFRAVIGGAVVARRGGHVLIVLGRLPESGDAGRDRAFEGIARAALDGAGQ
jgi:hypothetical protein